MVNPRTTITGILLLVAAAARVVAALLMGQDVPDEAWAALVAALAGLGLITASDGKP
jgi:hypothetical protein